jgi:LEA14-like dessication related protein
MKRSLRALPLAALVLPAALGAGCAGLKELARTAFQEPRLDFRSASVDALDLEGATIGVHVDLTNPNAFGLDVAKVTWAFDAEGTRVASGDMPGGLRIPATGTAPLAFPVRVRFRDVPGIAGLLGRRQDSLRYGVKGSVGVRTPVGVVELPVAHEGRLPLPGLPSFSLERLAVRGVSLRDVAFDVHVGVKNPNPFPLPGGRLAWTVALGSGAPVARADGAQLASLPASGRGEVVIPIRLDLVSAGRAAADIARGGDVRVRLAGTAEVAGISVPLDLDALMPARR